MDVFEIFPRDEDPLFQRVVALLAAGQRAEAGKLAHIDNVEKLVPDVFASAKMHRRMEQVSNLSCTTKEFAARFSSSHFFPPPLPCFHFITFSGPSA